MSADPSASRLSLPPLSTFVGRTAQLELGHRLLEESRLVTITGPGGAGKTRLARELTRSTLLAFCDLSPATDLSAVDGAIAAAFGLQTAPGGGGRGRVLRHLRGADGVLVVDNCEHVLEAAAELVETVLARAPSVRVLATSQEALDLPGERLLRLGSLSALDARDLFVERVREGEPGFELDQEGERMVGEICRRLDAIPLALELAAARVRTLPLQDLLASLEDRFALLRGSSRRAPSRQQTLEASVAWSYGLLLEKERALFQRIAVLPGRFSLAAAAAVAADALPAREVPFLLSRLGERSLLEVVGKEYRMAETLRAFGRERLVESGELGAVLVRGAAHFDQINAHRTGLALTTAALEVVAAGDSRRGALLDLAAKQAERAGRYEICAEALEELRGSDEIRRQPARLAAVELRLASALTLATGELDRALVPAERALAIYRQLGDEAAVLQAETELAWLDGLGGNLQRQLQRALATVEAAAASVPGSEGHLHALGCAAAASVVLGPAGQAQALLDEGLNLARRRGDSYQEGWFTGMLALHVSLRQGPSAGLRLLQDSREMVQEHLDPVFLEAQMLCHLLAGTPRALLDDLGSEADVIYGFGIRGAFLLAGQGAAAAELGQAGVAAEMLAAARRLSGGRDFFFQSRAHIWLEGIASWSLGDPAGAARTLQRSAEALLERDLKTFATLALRDAVDAAWDAGDQVLESELAARLEQIASELEGPFFAALRGPGGIEALGRLGCLGLRARAIEREGRLEEAAAIYEELGMRRRQDRALARIAAGGGEAASPIARLLTRLVLFDGVSWTDLEPVAASAVRMSFAEGESVLTAGAPAEALYAVTAGRARLTARLVSSDGAQVEVGAGDLIGERSLLGGEANVTGAVAITDLEVVQLLPAAVLELVGRRPALAERLVALVHQRVRQESRLTGEAEPPDIAGRLLGSVQGKEAAAGGPPPAFEILPVYLADDGAWLLRPGTSTSWLVDAEPGQLPAAVVGGALDRAGCPAEIVHSTSWRYDSGRLVLSYLAIMPAQRAIAGFEREQVRRAELARGSAKGAPRSIDVGQVVEHGLRHLSWLSRDDPVIREELSPRWLAVVADYQPEPFRAL